MKIVMTAMVRDEADIIGPMIEHHLAQGVERFVVTDNGSVDGTAEILERYAAAGLVDLRHDPVHRKQQGSVVTAMARDAYSIHGADWVLNADADEFWMPRSAPTLRDALAEIPSTVGAFQIPVVDMVGPPSAEGSGLQRLVYRDLRTEDSLRRVGLRAHSSPNVIHVGRDDVVVGQGNHEVSIPAGGAPEHANAFEVLHYPWRSWAQFERKVRNSGEAYLASPDLQPSPNHHGMIDYRRLKDGTLLAYYLLRHTTDADLAAGLATGELVEDRRIAETQASPIPDRPLTIDHPDRLRRLAGEASEARLSVHAVQRELDDAVRARDELEAACSRLESRLEAEQAELARLSAEYANVKRRKTVRLVDAASRIVRR